MIGTQGWQRVMKPWMQAYVKQAVEDSLSTTIMDPDSDIQKGKAIAYRDMIRALCGILGMQHEAVRQIAEEEHDLLDTDLLDDENFVSGDRRFG